MPGRVQYIRTPNVPRVEFISQVLAESITTPPPNSALISLWSQDFRKPILASWPLFFQLHIWDQETTHGITQGQVNEIKQFFSLCQSSSTINYVVHCRMGISRSAAVAKWIAEELDIWFPDNYTHYNKRIYQMLKET